ncbi:MAG: amidophosphoribosyltransferase [Desulfobacterales bacterium CG23_combo_of_CG06-09_8_20_14_all_51_8]|nr:MAG: amidophosphoribosyltransferase [Desulfobacterales bacterium CG23_combo_of_CG06-09_8_20_14_all_51_8]
MGGFFGCVARRDCTQDVFYGTDYHSHLGTKRGGLAVGNREGIKKIIKNIENSYFRTKLESEIAGLSGRKGIGVISDTDSQPLIISSHLGTFAIATVGKIKNLSEIAQNAFHDKINFSESGENGINPTELVAMLVSRGSSFADGLSHAQETIQGSCSILLMTEKGIFAARDRLGRTPIVIGRKPEAWAASFETCAFFNPGYQIEKYLGPGEIVFFDADACTQVKKPGDRMQICSFLWVYYGYPASGYEGINVEEVRYRCGQALARKDTVEIDVVSGIPDSGIGHALGYANERKVPYCRPFVKYTPTWPRSFMPQDQESRDLVARMKLIPVRELIDGKRLLFCDDSIVRGTQLKDNIQMLFDAGAKEVHMRTACPTLIFPCEFLNFSTSRSTLDLIGRKVIHEIEGPDFLEIGKYAVSGSPENLAMADRVRDRLKVTSLKYQTLEDLVAVIGLPKENLCTHCWDGTSCF